MKYFLSNLGEIDIFPCSAAHILYIREFYNIFRKRNLLYFSIISNLNENVVFVASQG